MSDSAPPPPFMTNSDMSIADYSLLRSVGDVIEKKCLR